uniref:LIM zinc-binding domain-containing protein n=1 Tax=Cyprinus carpio TaxID=7962 RepID=A0A8C1PTD2_CYPCA
MSHSRIPQRHLRLHSNCFVTFYFLSTVCKPRFPRTAEPPPAFSSSSVLGGGLSELDHLLQELNATQFNITDEILAQFPSTKKDDQFSKSGPSSTGSAKPSATSATLELDKLMASLSDFRVQSTPAAPEGPVASSSQQTASPPSASSGGSLDSMLGLLQSDLSRQGVPTSSKGNCSACQKPVVGQVVTALGRVWHPEHFVCSECECELGNCNFFEKDGQPYCEPDYFTLYSPHCAQCNKPILNKMVTALDKNWHPECFSCVKCSSTFGDEGFHDREGKQYCQKCFLALFASHCQGCSQPIMENYISALSALWHPQCFVCRVSRSWILRYNEFVCVIPHMKGCDVTVKAVLTPKQILKGSYDAISSFPFSLECYKLFVNR